MKIVIASNNKHKIEEISQILVGFETVSLAQAGIVCDPEENGKNFAENAEIKAREIAKHTNLPVLADDTGLCINALGGAPGVFSARYAQAHNDAANRKKVLEELRGATDRTAYFECAVVLLYPNGKALHASGRVNGRILEEECGENGFGYDSLFFSDELGKTFAQATVAEKHSVSHRGRALQKLLQLL